MHLIISTVSSIYRDYLKNAFAQVFSSSVFAFET